MRLAPLQRVLGSMLLAALCAAPAGAATVGYWRMEADLDPSAQGLLVANELAFGSALTSASAFVDTLANPTGTVPATGSANFGSLGSTQQGGTAGINATATWYSQLDVSSISIEFWARTVENQATLFSRSTGGFDGITIDSPSALTITYHVSDGAGGATRVTLANLFDMDSTWHHLAFTYDEVMGLGSFYVDGALVGQNDGADNRALVWGTQVDLRIGTMMDYAAAFNGTLDEVRISDLSLAPTAFLSSVPEAGPVFLLASGLLGLAVWRPPARASEARRPE